MVQRTWIIQINNLYHGDLAPRFKAIVNMAQTEGAGIVLLVMRAILSIPLAGIIGSADCWIFNALGMRAGDLVCGHNIYLQWPLALFVAFFLLGLIHPFRKAD